ncbi:hypothetical protein [Agrobacterium vitis]|uniref:hypothetical protein n=1 Tax=Agrobacterium vitis TaxID=373 RepID=UPI0015722CBF|nr:hypothetical protein [Agrobacterium vitis]NSZ16351.1 hypothetical protein [Agrobacterium vitis]QZO05106.1 hypothetical protein K4831_06150 [Agrobacterium vitis]UJL87254.1 hypothetical protein AVF2S5_04490 [Agrobacterium vitis]
MCDTNRHPDVDDATSAKKDSYALFREEHNENHGAGWWVDLRRRGMRVVRLFKDSIYGSPQASFDQAKAYRDAVMSVLPPATNHEQAVLLRKNNKSGISGVRHVELAEDEAWEASLLTRTEHKREKFSLREYGEEQAKAMAIALRRKWLEELPVKHLAYAEHSEEMTRQYFGDQLAPVSDVLPEVSITKTEAKARLKAINAHFDALRPPRLRVRVKSYQEDRLSVHVSDAGFPAQRKLVILNTKRLSTGETLAMASNRIMGLITAFYNPDVADWFMENHGRILLDPTRYDPDDGFNVLLFVPVEIAKPAAVRDIPASQ